MLHVVLVDNQSETRQLTLKVVTMMSSRSPLCQAGVCSHLVLEDRTYDMWIINDPASFCLLFSCLLLFISMLSILMCLHCFTFRSVIYIYIYIVK